MSTKTEVGTREAAFLLNISAQRLRLLLKQGRVEGAKKVDRFWKIPLFKGMPVISKGDRGPSGTWRKRLGCSPTRVHVNRYIISYNQKYGLNLPPLLLKRGNKTEMCHEIEIGKLIKIVYRPDHKTSSGAVVWIEFHPSLQLEAKLFEPYDPQIIDKIKKKKLTI